jgi:peptide/nickel transport system ATP-binding protein
VQESRCRDEEPLLRELEGHHVACHWAEDIKAGRIEPKSRVPVFDPGLQPAAWEPPPT